MASLISYFILTTAVLTYAILSQKMCTNLSNVPGFKNGYTLHTGVMRMHKLEGVFKCFYFCKEMASCMSFSYDVIMGECHMFDMIGSADTLLMKENHIFANVMPSELKGLPNNQTLRKQKNKTKTTFYKAARRPAFPVGNVVRSVKHASKLSDSTKANNETEIHPKQHLQGGKISNGQADSETVENAEKETVTVKEHPPIVAAEDPPDTNEGLTIIGSSKRNAFVKRNIKKKNNNNIKTKEKKKRQKKRAFNWGDIGAEIIENAKKTG